MSKPLSSDLASKKLTLEGIRQAYRNGLTVVAMVESLLERLRLAQGDNAWISLVDDESLRCRARELDELRASDPGILGKLVLFGVPFGVKDNIDAAALPTTAGCPAFAYQPEQNAPAVAALLAAGAVLVGKNNLDQFATGLVGTRSTYGAPKNPFNADYISGGSSSGSAVAVANGSVAFTLGTDTAGSGRVPAGFNNIVGLKPTPGLVSTRGVVPACRSLDCVSVFANTIGDATAVLDVIAGFDADDPFSRRAPALPPLPQRFRLGVPKPSDLIDCGDPQTKPMFEKAVARLAALGGEVVEVPLALFRAAGDLLYSGPWLAERLASVEPFLRDHADAVLPVTRTIIERGHQVTGADAFRGQHKLTGLRREAEALWREIDVLVTPTTPTHFTHAEIEAEPFKRNVTLGTYTDFANLLDLAALAIPAGFKPNGLPFSITLFGPAFTDEKLAALGRRFENPDAPAVPASNAAGCIPLLVFGAHLSGMALNAELLILDATLVRAVRTAPLYRQYLLESKVFRPGVIRDTDGNGKAIEAELWSLPETGFARFVAAIAPPLGIGTVELEDGTSVKGFLCEAWATRSARDITEFGGWRGFVGSGGLSRAS